MQWKPTHCFCTVNCSRYSSCPERSTLQIQNLQVPHAQRSNIKTGLLMEDSLDISFKGSYQAKAVASWHNEINRFLTSFEIRVIQKWFLFALDTSFKITFLILIESRTCRQEAPCQTEFTNVIFFGVLVPSKEIEVFISHKKPWKVTLQKITKCCKELSHCSSRSTCAIGFPHVLPSSHRYCQLPWSVSWDTITKISKHGTGNRDWSALCY